MINQSVEDDARGVIEDSRIMTYMDDRRTKD